MARLRFSLALLAIATGSVQCHRQRLLSATIQAAKESSTETAEKDEDKHRLRVCNAFSASETLELHHKTKKKEEKLSLLATKNGVDKKPPVSLAYKECKQLKLKLSNGDKLEFRGEKGKSGGSKLHGTFSVAGLPKKDTMLLLVLHRKSAVSTKMAFESHVYSKSDNPQLAVLDVYQGDAKSQVKVSEKTDGKLIRTEKLKYDSVVAVNPGEYDMVLVGSDGEEVHRTPLKALGHENYVVMRVGTDAKTGPSKPQELVVFPELEEKKHSDAVLARPGKVLTVALMVLGTLLAGTCEHLGTPL